MRSRSEAQFGGNDARQHTNTTKQLRVRLPLNLAGVISSKPQIIYSLSIRFVFFPLSRNYAVHIRPIIIPMARGWESKSVEAQQAEAGDKSSVPRKKLSLEDAARARDRETIRLSRKRVAQQLESARNPRLQKQLQDALIDLDKKLEALGEV